MPYNLADYRGMLPGSYIKITAGDYAGRAAFVEEVSSSGGYFSAALQLCDGSTGYARTTVRWRGDNVLAVLDWSRPRAMHVRDSRGNIYYARNSVRRTRAKGLSFPSTTFNRLSTSDNINGESFSGTERHYLAMQLLEDRPQHESIKGQFALVKVGRVFDDIGDWSAAQERNAEEREVLNLIMAHLARQGNFNRTHVVPSELTRSSLMALAQFLNITLSGLKLFHKDTAIAEVNGTEIKVKEQFDLLVPAIARRFSNYTVTVREE